MSGTMFRCVISPCDRGPVVVVPRDGAWSLPEVTCREGWLAQAVPEIRAGLALRLGLDTIVLRELQLDAGAVCAELEPVASQWRDRPRHGWREVEPGRFAELDDATRTCLAAWWTGDPDEPRSRRPWECRGWFHEAAAWAEQQARRAGLVPSGEVLQVKAAWDGSCVLQLATDEGSLFFKAYPTRTPGEAEVIRMLEEWWPGDVPRLVADDPAAGWMLMRDWGAGDLLGAPAEELGRAVRRFGEIQRGESGRTGAWRAIGCPERGVAQLEQGMVRWLVDLPGLLVAAGVLTGGERDELAALVDPALSWCSRLPELDVPLVSIHHEDLRDGNVVAVDGHHVFSDWSDTVLSHPFFSVQRFLDFVDPPRGEEPWQWWFDHPQDVTRRVVRDQYLAAWEGVAPTDRLHEAFRLTRRLNPLAVLMRFDAAYDLDTVLVSPPADVAEVARELYDSVLGVARVAAWQTGGRRRGRRRLFRRRAGTR